MNYMKKISIIIAAYNEERFIKHCLMSLLDQSRQADELIVVDDGSNDSTWNILKELKKKYLSIKIFRLSHREQAAARNFGFSKSKGDILVFPDADYYFDNKFIEVLTAPILKNKAVATFTKDEYIANPENIWSRCWNINRMIPEGERILRTTPNRTNNFRAIRRKEFTKAGGFSETGYNNDVSVLNKLGLLKAGMAVNGAICYHYNPDSLKRVFRGSRRLGSKDGIPLTFKNILIYSFPNSIRSGLIKLSSGHPKYIIFKIVFDFGVIVGFVEKTFTGFRLKDIKK